MQSRCKTWKLVLSMSLSIKTRSRRDNQVTPAQAPSGEGRRQHCVSALWLTALCSYLTSCPRLRGVKQSHVAHCNKPAVMLLFVFYFENAGMSLALAVILNLQKVLPALPQFSKEVSPPALVRPASLSTKETGWFLLARP